MSLVLVLDDSATMVMSLSRILKNANYTVESGADGCIGMTKLRAGLKPVVILTDLNMPNMDGLTFIKEARRHAATRFVPIIMLTTESGGGKREEARAAGASAWLTKPTDPATLLSTLKQLLPSA